MTDTQTHINQLAAHRIRALSARVRELEQENKTLKLKLKLFDNDPDEFAKAVRRMWELMDAQ
jgi:hypothetical protein